MNVIPPKSPVLALPPAEYTPNYFNQLLSSLRLYFNQLDATHRTELDSISSLQTDWYYGVFSDATTQTISVINTATPVTFDTTDNALGIARGSPTSRIVCSYAAMYNFQFSMQLRGTSSATRDVYIWPRVNGVDIPNAATRITISHNDDYVVPAWNFVLPVPTGGYFELMWAADSTAVYLAAEAATAFCPAIPSVILTATRITQ